MDIADLRTALCWAAAEGWNPGRHDAACFLPADPAGFLAGELDGRMIGSLSAVDYGRYGFVGLYIVDPAFRGRGHGAALWRHGMARLAGRPIGLDGVPAQQPNYRRGGFVAVHRTPRHAGRGGGRAPAGLVPAATVDPTVLAAYDGAIFAAERAAFLAAWIAQPGTVALALPQGGAIAGYGVVRPCRAGWKIGPLFADDAAAAGRLLDGLAAAVPGEAFTIDVPEANRAAVALIAARGLPEAGFETARMYAGGPPPPVDTGRVFGLTSLELG